MQRLRQQIIAQRRAERALGLAVEQRHVLVTHARQTQVPLGIQLTNGNPLFEQCPCVATDPWRPAIGLGTQQQRPGITGELATRDTIGIDEEPSQAVETLFLILETLLDTAETLTGKQFETLLQLAPGKITSAHGQQQRQQPTQQQHQHGDQPGRGLFADKAKNLGAYGMRRHRRQLITPVCLHHFGLD